MASLIARRRYSLLLATSMISSAGAACNQSSFGGSSGSKVVRAAATGTSQSTDPAGDPGTTGTDDVEPKSDTGAPASTDATVATAEDNRCLSRPVDVRVVFLLDATGSMQQAIDLVKSNVKAFSTAVQSISFDAESLKVASVDIGMITYRDDKSELRQIAFGPVDQLATSLGWIVAEGGNDNFEGGLTALLAGLKMIEDKPQAPDHDLLPVIVAITDNFSHNGEGGLPAGAPPTAIDSYQLRDCRVSWSPLGKKLGRAIFDRLLVYDATPSVPSPEFSQGYGPCGGYEGPGDTPSKQWQDLRALWGDVGKGRKASALGRGFGFPFTSNALLSTLPQDLAASFKACKAE